MNESLNRSLPNPPLFIHRHLPTPLDSAWSPPIIQSQTLTAVYGKPHFTHLSIHIQKNLNLGPFSRRTEQGSCIAHKTCIYRYTSWQSAVFSITIKETYYAPHCAVQSDGRGATRRRRSNVSTLLSLTLRRLMSYIYIYGAPILDVSRSHTTTQHSR